MKMDKNKIIRESWDPELTEWFKLHCTSFYVKEKKIFVYLDYSPLEHWKKGSVLPWLNETLKRIGIKDRKIYIGKKEDIEKQLNEEQILERELAERKREQKRMELERKREEKEKMHLEKLGRELEYGASFVHLLRSYPVFEQIVRDLRKEYKIDTQKVKKMLYKHLIKKYKKWGIDCIIGNPLNLWKKYIKVSTKAKAEKVNTIMDIIDINLGADLLEAERAVLKWEIKTFPKLYSKIIASLRNLGFILTKSLIKPIANYILYGNFDPSIDVDWHKPIANLQLIWDPSEDISTEIFFEPHIQIKIYGQTNINDFKKELSTITQLKKRLPGLKIKKLVEIFASEKKKGLLRNGLYYFLRVKNDITHKEANYILKAMGLSPIHSKYASQIMRRWEKVLLAEKRYSSLRIDSRALSKKADKIFEKQIKAIRSSIE